MHSTCTRRTHVLREDARMMVIFDHHERPSYRKHPLSLSEGSARGSRRKQLFSERPSGSFTSGGLMNLFRFLRLPPEGRASFASFGFLRKASPMAGWRLSERRFTSGGLMNLFLRDASPLALPEGTSSASFGKTRVSYHTSVTRRSEGSGGGTAIFQIARNK